MDPAWYQRTTTSFPLSIGTGLAFESVFKATQPAYDPARVIPEHINIKNYTVFYINLETLVRNILGSVDKSVYMAAKAADVADILAQEKEIIDSLMKNEGGDAVIPIYYYNDLTKITERNTNQFIYPRIPNTDLQKFQHNLTKAVIDIFLKDNKEDRFVRRFSGNLKPVGMPTGLIMSHIPYDLTSYHEFRKLDLLESHTGKLKNRSLWYTKFYKMGDSDLSYIPFHKRFLYIFGDHVLFSPWSMKPRLTIYDVAKKYEWNYSTTEEKIRLNLDIALKDRFLFNTIMAL